MDTVIFPVFSRKIFPTFPQMCGFKPMPCMSGDNLSTHKKNNLGFPWRKGAASTGQTTKMLRCAFWNLLMLKSWRIWLIFWAKRLVGYTQVTPILAEGHCLLLAVQHATSEMPNRKPRKTHEAFWWNPRLEKALEVYQAPNEKCEGRRLLNWSSKLGWHLPPVLLLSLNSIVHKFVKYFPAIWRKLPMFQALGETLWTSGFPCQWYLPPQKLHHNPSGSCHQKTKVCEICLIELCPLPCLKFAVPTLLSSGTKSKASERELQPKV